jgi:hypothetical protein
LTGQNVEESGETAELYMDWNMEKVETDQQQDTNQLQDSYKMDVSGGYEEEEEEDYDEDYDEEEEGEEEERIEHSFFAKTVEPPPKKQKVTFKLLPEFIRLVLWVRISAYFQFVCRLVPVPVISTSIPVLSLKFPRETLQCLLFFQLLATSVVLVSSGCGSDSDLYVQYGTGMQF